MKKRTHLTFKQWLKQSAPGKFVIVLFAVAFGAIGYFTLFRSNAQSTIDSTVQVRVEGYPGTIRVRTYDSSGASNGTFGNCNTVGNLKFTIPAVCTGERFGPPNGVTLVLDQPAPSGYVFDGWERRTNNTDGTVICGVSSCFFNFSTSGTIVRANFHQIQQPPPPPPPIGVVLKANGQTGTINLTTGATLNLSWTTTNSPTSCASLSGTWGSGAAKAVPSGSENRSGDTASAGTKTYTIFCSKSGTASVSSTVTVNVISPPPTGGGGTGGGGSGGGGSGGGGTPRPSNPRIVVTQPSSPAASQADTESPSVPSDFLAVADEEQGTVRLTWTPSTDNVGVDHYQLERSIDQVTWEALSDSLPYAEYIDTTTQFTTKYFYRVRAFDAKGNASGYAGVDVTTAAFKVNVTAKDGGEIKTDDESVSVRFPADALKEDAQCSVSESEEVPTTEKGFSTVGGPFKVVCKTANNENITIFEQPLQITVTTASEIRKKHSLVEIIVLSSDQWETVTSQNDGETDSFELTSGNTFAVVAKAKSTPLFVKILLIFLLLATVGGAIIGILYVRYRRQQQAQYDNYVRQQSGLWK